MLKRLRLKAKDVFDYSVFKPWSKTDSMETILAILFHRSSATLYAIYTAWAIISTWAGIPTLVDTQGTNWQIIFSICVGLFAAPAAFGATLWPRYARLELFSGTMFVSLMILYIFFSVINAIYNGGSWASPALLTSIVVIPLARVIIVCIFLVRQAEDRKKAAWWRAYSARTATSRN